MFDDNQERPPSLRMKKLQELVAELQMMLDAPDESEAPAEPMPEPGLEESNAFPPKEEKPV